MKCNSDKDLEISFNQIQMVERCFICQEHSSSLTLVEKAFIGTPPILISDLLLQCFDSLDKFRLILGEQPSNNRICDTCEKSLEGFYKAVQKVSIKRNEFLHRVQDKNYTTDGVEYFIIIESPKKDSNSPGQPTKFIMDEESNSDPSEDDFVKIIDADNEYLTLNTSEDEFVKVKQPAEEFEDGCSSDCSVKSDGKKGLLIYGSNYR